MRVLEVGQAEGKPWNCALLCFLHDRNVRYDIITEKEGRLVLHLIMQCIVPNGSSLNSPIWLPNKQHQQTQKRILPVGCGLLQPRQLVPHLSGRGFWSTLPRVQFTAAEPSIQHVQTCRVCQWAVWSVRQCSHSHGMDTAHFKCPPERASLPLRPS